MPFVTLNLGEEEVEALVDTGFNGALMLPKKVIEKLNVHFDGNIKYTLANGDEALTDVYTMDMLWFGRSCEVYVVALDEDLPLLGMALLNNARTVIDPRRNLLSIES